MKLDTFVTARKSLHQSVATHLRQLVAKDMCPRQKLPPEAALARELRVSTHTLRQALALLAEEGIIERRHGSGTFVADTRSRQHVALVLGVHPLQPQVNYYCSATVDRLQKFLSEKELAVRVYWARSLVQDDKADPAFDDLTLRLSEGRIAGIVAVTGPFDSRWRKLFDECAVPLLRAPAANDVMLGQMEDTVIREGTRRLLQEGRRRIAIISSAWRDPIAPNDSVARARRMRTAFAEIMAAAGAETREEWIADGLAPTTGGAAYAEIRRLWDSNKDKPDGLLICDDYWFRDAATAILELGIAVPEDLLVVTHANKGSGMTYPFRTWCIEIDVPAVADALGEKFIEMLQGNAPTWEPRPDLVRFVEHGPPKVSRAMPVSERIEAEKGGALNGQA